MHPWPPIGENIARLRSLSGLTQEELAERAGVSVDLIRRLEQGNRQTALIGSLYKIATAPRGAVLYPPRSGERLEEVSLDLMALPGLERERGR